MKTIAQLVFDECLSHDCPSNHLAECDRETERDQDWHTGTTSYLFSDGSIIKDCAGFLSI